MRRYITASILIACALHTAPHPTPSSLRGPAWSTYRAACVDGIASIYADYRRDKDSDQGRFHAHPGPWTEEREFQKACTAKADAKFLGKGA